MSLDQQSALSREEIDTFLATHETAVLSLARDGDPYAIPISYGYDGSRGRFYLRLVSTPDSTKRAFLSSSPRARVVVYEEAGATYQSVVAAGTLEEVEADELTADHIEQFGDAKRPLFEMWGADKPDLDIALYELDPDDVSGRRLDLDEDG